MNQPDRFEKFVLPDGKAKVECIKDDKISNAATFILERETHTIGNLLRMELLQDDHVIFAGYRQPHPLQHNIQIKVQTDGDESPVEAVQNSVEHLIQQIDELKRQFTVHYDHYHRQRNTVKQALAQANNNNDETMF